MIAKEKVNKEVSSFYVSLPFKYQIVLVDLVNKTVHQPLSTCFAKVIDQYAGKCIRPEFLGAETDNDILLVTTRSGFFGINTQTGVASLYTNPNMAFAGSSVDGDFNQAQVGKLGPPTPVPGRDGLFLVADYNNFNIRSIDINKEKIYSLCISQVFRDTEEEVYGTTQAPAMVNLPPCNLDYPYSVMFRDNSSSEIFISQRYRVTYFKLSCKCEILI